MKHLNVTWMMLVIVGVFVSGNEHKLTFKHYEISCPNVENIVKRVMLPIFLTDPTAPAAFLRLMFHDCQVQGRDASIVLNPKRRNSEMVSPNNFGIRKLDSIDVVKSALEVECPGQVSCADIIAMAAKESVAFSGGPQIRLPLGRRDSKVSSSYEADTNLLSPQISVDKLLQTFMKKGMYMEESIAILGAHTLGVGHCINIVERLYDHKEEGKIDYNLKAQLRLTCPTKVPTTNLTFVTNDDTPFTFDNHYYKGLVHGRGLFGIDASIAKDDRTALVVREFAENQSYFFQIFTSAFVKLSSTNVLVGKHGEIRSKCSRIN